MEAIAEMLQRNPALVLVLVCGVPAVTWAAAYARRPSRVRRRVAIAAFVATVVVVVLAAVEARRGGASLVPAVVCGGATAALWGVAMLVAKRR
jgi:hypothetical protein